MAALHQVLMKVFYMCEGNHSSCVEEVVYRVLMKSDHRVFIESVYAFMEVSIMMTRLVSVLSTELFAGFYGSSQRPVSHRLSTA